MPSHLSKKPHHYRPLTHLHYHHAFSATSALLPSPPLQPLTDISSRPSRHPSSQFLTLLSSLHPPPGPQGASGLPPSDWLRWHHGSSVLSERRLGPRESLTFFLPFSNCLFHLLLDFILTFIISSNGEENHYLQVKMNPSIDLVWRERRKTVARLRKVKSKCTGSASLSCPAASATLSRPDESSSCGLWAGDWQQHKWLDQRW